MAENIKELAVTLPEGLRRQFDDVRRRLWRVETTVAAGAIVAGLFVSLLALFISDRLWDTPPWLRTVFALLGLGAALIALGRWARRWIWRKPGLDDLANLVQKKYRRLGDRLLGIVELAQEQRHQANFSPALYQAAIRQVAEEARQYDFRQSVASRPAKKFGLGAAAAVCCALALALVLPQASWNAFLRWAEPVGAIPRYTLVTLEGLPRELIVAHGEPFVVSGIVHYRSFWKPGRIFGKLLNLPDLEGSVDSGKIRLQVPGQVANGMLRLQVGDAMAEVKILPVHRPSLQEMAARIQLPDYLHYSDQTLPVQGGSMQAVEGSRIAFLGKVSRPLTSASMQAEGGEAGPLKIDGESFTSAPSQPAKNTEFTFQWRDDLGLSNAEPLRLSVAMQKDAPPVAQLPGMPRESAILVSDVMHIRVEAVDDFGLLDVGLTWDLSSDSPLTEGYTSEIKNMPPSSRSKKVEKVFLWSPREFRIPPDSTVELQGFARDFYPGRERSRTAEYRIRVLSPEEHAELVREELEAVMARIEEVTRLQEKITANLMDVKDAEKLTEAQKSERVGQSRNDQLANSQHLDEMSRQAQQALREAMKNPEFPPDTIRQWSQSAQQWEALAQQKMKNAANSMQSAQQSSSSQKQQMADAAQKSEDILKALEKMQDKTSQHMDQLQALTLAKRLRKVGAQEKEIGARLLKAAPDIIGLPTEDLSDKFKQFDLALTSDQGRARKESDTLEGEISRFYERTQKTNYGAVSKEMKDDQTGDELDRVGGLIGDNIAIEASGRLDHWSERFTQWGDKLEPKSDSSGSGQSPGGQSQAKDMTEQLIALLRLRESEMTLRDQTSVLDQQKASAPAVKDQAKSLSDTQKKLAVDLGQIDTKVNIPQLEPAFAETAGAMERVETMLQVPETGKPADTAEGKTVDSISDLVNLINEQAQHGQPSPSQSESSGSAEEMSFLMRMMQNSGEAKNVANQPAAGLNRAGGSTDRASNPINGNASGKGTSSRQVDKASGAVENSPAEFRDAMDIYFHGIEHQKN